MDVPEIIVSGKENGEGMLVRYRTARDVDIFGFGLGMPNIYSDTDWDLGPTWCYLVLGNKTHAHRYLPLRQPRGTGELSAIHG